MNELDLFEMEFVDGVHNSIPMALAKEAEAKGMGSCGWDPTTGTQFFIAMYPYFGTQYGNEQKIGIA